MDKGREIHVHVNFFDENFISTALKTKQTIFQVRGGSYGKAEDDSDEEESGDELHRNKRNCCD